MRGDASRFAQHHGRKNDLQKFQRVCRVFLARLLMAHGTNAPEVLHHMADELAEPGAEAVRNPVGDIPTRFPRGRGRPRRGRNPLN